MPKINHLKLVRNLELPMTFKTIQTGIGNNKSAKPFFEIINTETLVHETDSHYLGTLFFL